MSIENVFNAGESNYIIECYDESNASKISQKIIDSFFIENPKGIVWSFYKKNFGLIKVRDGVTSETRGILNISRTETSWIREKTQVQKSVSLDCYLENIECVYLQLCGQKSNYAGGIEIKKGITTIGRYDFSHSLLPLVGVKGLLI